MKEEATFQIPQNSLSTWIKKKRNQNEVMRDDLEPERMKASTAKFSDTEDYWALLSGYSWWGNYEKES